MASHCGQARHSSLFVRSDPICLQRLSSPLSRIKFELNHVNPKHHLPRHKSVCSYQLHDAQFITSSPSALLQRSRSRNPVMKPTVLSLLFSAFLPACLLALFVTFQVWQSFSCQFPFYSFSEVTLEQSICNIFIATVSNWLSELRRVISL